MESIRVFIGKIPELCRKNSIKESCSSCGYRRQDLGIERNCHRGRYFVPTKEKGVLEQGAEGKEKHL